MAGPLFDTPGYRLFARSVAQHNRIHVELDLLAYGPIATDTVAQSARIEVDGQRVGTVSFDGPDGPAFAGSAAGSITSTSGRQTADGQPFTRSSLALTVRHYSSTLDVEVVPEGFRGVLDTSLGVDDIALQADSIADVVRQIWIDDPATSVTLEPNQNARFRFTAADGQRLRVSMPASTMGFTEQALRLRGPDGATIIDTQTGANGRWIIESSDAGTYEVELDPQGDTSGTATIEVADISDVEAVAPVDGSDTVVALQPGQGARLSFTASQGQRLEISTPASMIGYDDQLVRVHAPDGTTVVDTYTSANGRWYIDPAQAGTYRMQIAASPVAGSLTVRVDDVTGRPGPAPVVIDCDPAQPSTTALSEAIAADAPLVHWRLDDAGLTAADSSGQNHVGTYRGSPATGQPALRADGQGSSVTFDGLDDMISAPSAQWMQTADLTVEALIKPSHAALTGTKIIAARDDANNWGASRSWALQLVDGRLNALVQTGTGQEKTVGPRLQPGETYHVTFSYDQTIVRIYLNGAQIGSYPHTGALSAGAVGGPTPGRALVVGYNDMDYRHGSYPWKFAGDIDEFAMYGTALNPQRVAVHAGAATGHPVTSAPPTCGRYTEEVLGDAPLVYWPLDETAGQIAGDASGNGRHGVYYHGAAVGRPSLRADGSSRPGAKSRAYVASPCTTPAERAPPCSSTWTCTRE